MERALPHLYIYTDTDSCSSCFMFHNSSLASFIVDACEKQILSFVTSSLSVSSLQDRTTCCMAPVDFLKILILKSQSLTLQAWSILLIQSSKACLFLPSKTFIEVNIASFALSLLALVSSWKASGWLFWLAAIISNDLDCMLASSINVVLRT